LLKGVTSRWPFSILCNRERRDGFARDVSFDGCLLKHPALFFMLFISLAIPSISNMHYIHICYQLPYLYYVLSVNFSVVPSYIIKSKPYYSISISHLCVIVRDLSESELFVNPLTNLVECSTSSVYSWIPLLPLTFGLSSLFSPPLHR
jgi:hypothetical protein